MAAQALGNNIDDWVFLGAWLQAYEAGETQTQVSKGLNVSSSTVSVKAQSLRAAGVDLPRLRKERRSRDEQTIASLNVYIRERISQMETIKTLLFRCGHPKVRANIKHTHKGYEICRECSNVQLRMNRSRYAKKA